MKRMMKSIMTCTLAFMLIVTQLTSVHAMTTDYSGHWGEAAIEKWMEAGVISGYPSGEFKPNNAVTRAEFVTILDNVFDFQETMDNTYTDVKTTDWFADAVLKASSAGVVQGNNNMFRPMDTITRQEASIALYNAFNLSTDNATAYMAFEDSDDVATWALDQLNALVANGYMNGRGNNTLAPTANISRVEAITLVGNLIGELASSLEVSNINYAGNLVVNKADTTLANVTIDGNLYVTQGVAEGDITLNDVTIKGELVVLGGGENSIKLKNTSVGKLVVLKFNGKVRVFAEGSSEIKTILMKSGGKLEEGTLTGSGFGSVEVIELKANEELSLDGDFEEVTMDTPVKLTLSQGSIGKLTLNAKAKDSVITINKDAKVTNLLLNAKVEVKGSGTITNAEVKVAGSKFEQKPTSVKIADDVTVVVAGETKSGTVTTTTSTGGSTGSGSSSGSGSSNGGSTSPKIGLTFALSAGSTSHVVTIEAPSNASNKVVLEQTLMAVNNEFDNIFDEYNESVNENEGSFLIDSLKWFEYASQEMLVGTIFEGEITDLAEKTSNSNPNYTDQERKDIAHDVLNVIKANIANMELVQKDVTTIAEQVDFSSVQFDGYNFKSATVKKGADSLATYEKGADKAAFIEIMFTELTSINMNSNVDYSLVLILDDGTEEGIVKTATLSAAKPE